MKDKNKLIPVLYKLSWEKDTRWRCGFIDSENEHGDENRKNQKLVHNFKNSGTYVDETDIKYLHKGSKEYNLVFSKLDKAFPDEVSPWIPFTEKRPEDFVNYSVHFEYGMGANDTKLMYITEKVFVCWKNEFYVDCRRKFDGREDWIWTELEWLEDDENVFWMPIPRLNPKDEARFHRLIDYENTEAIKRTAILEYKNENENESSLSKLITGMNGGSIIYS